MYMQAYVIVHPVTCAVPLQLCPEEGSLMQSCVDQLLNQAAQTPLRPELVMLLSRQFCRQKIMYTPCNHLLL